LRVLGNQRGSGSKFERQPQHQDAAYIGPAGGSGGSAGQKHEQCGGECICQNQQHESFAGGARIPGSRGKNRGECGRRREDQQPPPMYRGSQAYLHPLRQQAQHEK
jgi:hypothetical protein